mmetsp:Transcript_101036/g.324488  ORF Transcript_101036/g.324488 Transcript_101036/m.324488 type:complete len:158 (-) Transcript_101036:1862-2335(-)
METAEDMPPIRNETFVLAVSISPAGVTIPGVCTCEASNDWYAEACKLLIWLGDTDEAAEVDCEGLFAAAGPPDQPWESNKSLKVSERQSVTFLCFNLGDPSAVHSTGIRSPFLHLSALLATIDSFTFLVLLTCQSVRALIVFRRPMITSLGQVENGR